MIYKYNNNFLWSIVIMIFENLKNWKLSKAIQVSFKNNHKPSSVWLSA